MKVKRSQKLIGMPAWLAAKRTTCSTLAALPFFYCTSAAAQGRTPVDISPLNVSSDIFTGALPKTAATTPGTSASEVLRGNGTPLGYKLTHGNVLANTVSVRAGGAVLRQNEDYWVDFRSGSLIFARPIKATEGISVFYRYAEGTPAAQFAGGLPGLQFSLGSSMQLGIAYATLAGDGSGLDTSLYGLSLNSKIGSGGQFGSLAYFSRTQVNTNLNLSSSLSASPSKPKNLTAGMDHLLSQNLNFQSSNFGLRAAYQDVGKNFAGFSALKASNSNNKAVLDQLTALEGEKGVRRLGLGFTIGGAANPADLKKRVAGLSLDWNKIEDGKGAITQETLGYSSRLFHFDYASRDVSSTFGRFKGLREADKTQWEREKGLKTSSLGFGLNFATNGKKEATGIFEIAQQSFQDKTSSFKRDQLRLNWNGLGINMVNRKADARFKRLSDLSDADKNIFALDLYRQFDPNAKPEQVTANDRAQVAKEAGLSRDALRIDDALGKTSQVSFSQMHITAAAAVDPKASGTAARPQGLERESAAIDTAQFTLNYTERKTDAHFDRFADLADVEKSNLVLDTRRQYDPIAKLEQVTQKDRDQLLKETGIERSSLRGKWVIGKGGKNGSFAFSQFRIADRGASSPGRNTDSEVAGLRLGYSSKAFQLNFSSQAVGNDFRRMADLSDADRAQLGNAYGLHQQQLGGIWQVSKTTKLSVNTLSVAGTRNAVSSAVLDALKKGSPIGSAAEAARSGLNRAGFVFETSGLSVTANRAHTDKDFQRANDLAVSDADKHAIASELGMNRDDIAVHFARIKGLTFDNSIYRASAMDHTLTHNVNFTNLQVQPNKRTSLVFHSDEDISALKGVKSGNEHTLFTFNQQLGKTLLVNFAEDRSAIFDKDKEASRTSIMRFDAAADKINKLAYETKNISLPGGKYENTTSLNVHAKPTTGLTFNYTRMGIERGQDASAESITAAGQTADKKDAPPSSESTDSFDVQWQTTKQFSVVLGVSQKETTDNKDADTVSVGLQGMPFKNVTVAAKFDEVHNDGKNTKDVADFAISNSKPFTIGPIQDLTVTARYASLNDQRKLQNETMTGRAAWKIHRNEFVLDYGGITKENGEVTISRLYSVTTDPNPKKWFHAGFYYKARTMVDGKEKLIRRFTADWRLSRKTNFVYMFGTLPEDDKGNILPRSAADISLKHALSSTLGTEVFYRLSSDDFTKKMTRSLGCGVNGQLSKFTKIGLDYSVDANNDGKVLDHSNHYRFSLDHQVTPDHFVTVSGEFRSHDGTSLKEELRANLDFRFIF